MELAIIRLKEKATSTTTADPGDSSMKVHVLVGGARPDVEARLYECPLYLLQSAATALRELLADLMEGALTEGLAAGATTVPLPYLSPDVFERIALYMEHFYAVSYHPSGRVAAGRASMTAVEQQTPTTLSTPVDVQELYQLQPWEHRYVCEQLLRLEPLLQRRGEVCQEATYDRWAQQGAWVDAMGGAAAGGCQLTEPERQGVVEHVGKVLEGARRLGVEGLTALCGALIANTVVDVSNDKLKNIVSTKGKGAEPLTPERRKELLQKFPALNPQSA